MYARLLQLVGIGYSPGVIGDIPQRVLQHAGNTDACGTFTPADGGPTAIVVGSRTPIASLRRLAERHRLEPEALALFARGVR